MPEIMSPHRHEARPIPSDATLVWLASERAAPLFRTLDRTQAFVPLIVLLAILPSVIATFGDVLTPEDAAWGLKALESTGSELPPQAAPIVEEIIPADSVRPVALWISGGMMRLVGTARPMSESLTSLLGGAALLFLLWPTAKSLSGPRFAFWVVLLAAFHPTLTSLLQFPAPVSCGLACSVGAIWGHMQMAGRSFRAVLIWIATVVGLLGSIFLIGPPAAIVAVVIFLDATYALVISLRYGTESRTSRSIAPARVFLRRLSAVTASLVIWGAIEYLLPESIGSGYETNLRTSDDPLEPETASKRMETVIVGPLWGLAAVGIGRLLRVANRGISLKGSRPTPRLLLSWLFVAGPGFVWLNGTNGVQFNPVERFIAAHLSLPLLCLAAFAIEEAARRTVSGAWILLAVALPLAVRLGSFMATIDSDGSTPWLLTVLLAFAAAWLFSKVLPSLAPIPGMRRGLLMGAVLLAIAVDAMDGLGVLFEGGDDDAPRQLVSQLQDERPRDTVVLLTDVSPPPELTYVLRSVFPRATMEIAASWDEASSSLDHRLGAGVRKPIVAAWGLRDAIGAASSDELRPTGKPLLFAGRELLLYVDDESP